jgi:hypothetical protein
MAPDHRRRKTETSAHRDPWSAPAGRRRIGNGAAAIGLKVSAILGQN